VLYSVVGLGLALAGIVVATRKAWLTTAVLWPLDTQFPDYLQDTLPVRGRWLAMACRMLTFPVVWVGYVCLALAVGVPIFVVLVYIIAQSGVGWL
jgi:hypothetical protein